MRNRFSPNSYPMLLLAIFVIGLFYFLNINIASADNGGININVKQELAANLSGADVQIQCAGGTWTAFGTTDGSGNISVLQAALPPGANCETDDEQIDIQVAKDGYVSLQSLVVAGNYRTGSQNTYNITGVQFAYKLTSITTEGPGTNLTATATSVQVGDDTALNACTLSGGAWYCPVVLANSDGTMVARVYQDGYVQKDTYDLVTSTTGRTAGTDAQVSDTVATVEFAYKLTSITTEGPGTNLTATATSVQVGDDTALNACTLSGGAWYCPVVLANSDGTMVARVYQDGYVQKDTYDLVTSTTGRTAGTDAQVSDTVNSVQFAFKVTGVATEISSALTTVTVTTGNAYGTSCTESSGAWYCAVPLANTGVVIKAVKDGYVTRTAISFDADRTGATDAQQTKAVTGVIFAYKITSITSETLLANLTATVTTLEVGDDTGRNACTLSGGSWYCPVVLANSDGTLISRVIQDGYVEKLTYALVTGTTRAAHTDAQLSDTIVGIQYGVKVTVVQQTSGVAISSATVTDDAGSVACVEGGTSGIYFCVVPLATTNRVVAASKSGYISDSAPHTDRTAHTDAQQTLTLTLALAGSGGGGGGGGGGGSSSNTTTTTTSPTTTTTTTPATTTATDIVSIINQEKSQVFGQTNPESYFINTGTETTLKLGSGERGAAVSSFKEAYGTAPKTEANWTDVLNIANGRWPLTVNKAVEARAYTNFKLVYGRNADMKNSTDVNALKMMGYGVRSTSDRNLTAERSAIVRFKATFGFNPTTARHWNIMRAIAYSGVVK